MEQNNYCTEWSKIVHHEHGFEWLVDGKPFIAFAGETHNSAVSSGEYMQKRVWPAVDFLHCNAVVAPVYWELCEPEEGVFDFAYIDSLIADARVHSVRLVLLWFGTIKNTISTYVPGWVKRDRKRFPRALPEGGTPCDHTTLTVCSEAIAVADAKAFSALMRHLRETDSEQHTVVMIQVENEVGISHSSRDHSPEAERMFAEPVPEKLLSGLAAKGNSVRPELKQWKRGTTWTECFGALADEVFSAWSYASFLQKVTAAGRKEYPLPCYVNAWLVYPGNRAGDYPSGGPVSRMKDIWQIAAPDVAFLAPDIYQPCFKEICLDYAMPDNPLFIPEAHRNCHAVSNLLYAVGQCGALCFSPFGFEDIPSNSVPPIVGNEIFEENVDRGNHDSGAALSMAYAVLQNLGTLIHEARRNAAVGGFLNTGTPGVDTTAVDGITFHAAYHKPQENHSNGAAMILHAGAYFYVVGVEGCVYPDRNSAEIESIEEGYFDENRKWIRTRRLNGDEFGCWFGAIPRILRLALIPQK